MAFYNERKVESIKMWLMFLLFGWSYGSMGQMGKQIAYYLTLGGFGIWGIYILFTLGNKVKVYNTKIAKEVGLSTEDMRMLGLDPNVAV